MPSRSGSSTRRAAHDQARRPFRPARRSAGPGPRADRASARKGPASTRSASAASGGGRRARARGRASQNPRPIPAALHETGDQQPALVGRRDVMSAQDPHRELRTKMAAPRRAAPRRSPRPARRLWRASTAPPIRHRRRRARNTSWPAPGARRCPESCSGLRPRTDPREAHRPAVIGRGLDAHRHARTLRVRSLPGGAGRREGARRPARLDRREPTHVQAGLPKQRGPVRLRGRGSRVARPVAERSKAGSTSRGDRSRPRPFPARRAPG